MRRSGSFALALTLSLTFAVAACSGGSDDGGDSPSTTVDPDVRPVTTDPPGTGPSTSVAALGDVAALDGVSVSLQRVASLDHPAMAMAVRSGDDDGIYLALRPGMVVRVDPAERSRTDPEPLLDFNGDVSNGGENGFLGIAFSPDGERFYTSYTNLAGDPRVEEYAVSGSGAHTTIDAGSRRVVLAQEKPFSNHNGGNIVFGPDGYLYVGLGDGGAASDPNQNSQDRSQLRGKILRIDPVAGSSTPYGVPADNPYADRVDGRREIWITGVRNPWRFSFDRATGDLWIGDVGEATVEEIDYLPANAEGRDAGRGANLGWSLMEGDLSHEGGEEPADHTPPVFTYRHADGGCAVIGGFVYRGTAIPDLAGAYVFVDRCQPQLQALLVADGQVTDRADLGAIPHGTVSFGQDATGELYVLAQSGRVSRIAPA